MSNGYRRLPTSGATACWLVLAWFAGCAPPSGDPGGVPAAAPAAVHGHADHDHAGHDHAHLDEALGPNGGHLLDLGDSGYRAEWLHDDQAGKVTVILLDGRRAEEAAVAAESIGIEIRIGDGAPKRYALPAINASGESPARASRFELIEPALVTGLQIGEGVQATLQIEIDGQPHSARIEHHAHGEHQH